MSTAVMAQVWQESSAKGNELLFLLALSDEAEPGGQVFLNFTNACKKSRLSEEEGRDVLNGLMDSGYLKNIDPRSALSLPRRNDKEEVFLQIVGIDPVPDRSTPIYKTTAETLLYVLVFKREPILKIGVTKDPTFRWSQLHPERFDFQRSLFVTSNDGRVIRSLERQLKDAFAHKRMSAEYPLPSGNSEVFCLSILKEVIKAIVSFKKSHPASEMVIRKNVSKTLLTKQ